MSDVKSDLFKDVKYYVTGSIEPEVILKIQYTLQRFLMTI